MKLQSKYKFRINQMKNIKKRLNFAFFLDQEKKNIQTQNKQLKKMRSSSNSIKNPMLKKKISGTNTSTNKFDQSSQMNKTLSSLSSTSSLKSQDKLSQLKQKLQKERQNMKKSGRRFKQNSSQIQIQTQQLNQIKSQELKSVTNKPRIKSTKKTNQIGISTSTATDLYDFNSIKTQVQNKTNKLFTKKLTSTKADPIIPTYTTQQILNSKDGVIRSNKNISTGPQLQKNMPKKQQIKVKNSKCMQRQSVNLMQLSSVIQKSPTKSQNNSLQKPSSSKQQSTIKFFDRTKVKKTQKTGNKQSLINNSKVFQSAINQQKKRNKQVRDFLLTVGLQSFSQALISLGFDEIETLIQVQVDDLNQLMMRAKQQDKLMKFIKQYKYKHQIEQQNQKPLIDRPSQIKSRLGFRPKSAALTTEPSDNNSIVQSSRMRSTTQNFNMGDSTLVNKSSIFYLMGGSQWSLESQIRKACSGCFKVSYEGIKRGDCYYCQNCDPGELDELDFSLNEFMVRNYH